ncbi:hypothetical protein ACF3MZ_16705 [Paenibacillaceae bacterium WGS1546]|uniref:hypothetical protein n=1 Tax=Cohnella sp. WGS1546 TaxID=3366810 RepID=UPI00372D2C53
MNKANWEKIKKHAAIPALAAAIVVIAAMAISTYRLKDNGTFELRDLSGSRDAIRDVTIRGELRDGVHRTRFRVEEGVLRVVTDISSQPYQSYPYRNSRGGLVKWGEGMDYSVEDRISSYLITSWERNETLYSAPVGQTVVDLPIHYRKPEGASRPNPLMNLAEYGIAVIGERVFFTVPVSASFSGVSYIYELAFYWWGYPPVNTEDYTPRKIVEIDLDAHKAGGMAGIEILGMESIGGRLALLVVENRELKIKSFDPDNGQFLGEASIPDFQTSNGHAVSGEMRTYQADYEAYVNHDRNLLTLYFRSSSSDANLSDATILTLDFTDGVAIVNRTGATFEVGGDDPFDVVSGMHYRNGKLFVIQSYQVPMTERSRVKFDWLQSKLLYLYVYEQSKLLYKGELVTDLNDDHIHAYNLTPGSGGFGYSQMDYRHFANLEIE